MGSDGWKDPLRHSRPRFLHQFLLPGDWDDTLCSMAWGPCWADQEEGGVDQGSDAPCWGSSSIFCLTFTCIIKHKVLSTQGFQNNQGRVWS